VKRVKDMSLILQSFVVQKFDTIYNAKAPSGGILKLLRNNIPLLLFKCKLEIVIFSYKED
jgi:hypothetical protein